MPDVYCPRCQDDLRHQLYQLGPDTGEPEFDALRRASATRLRAMLGHSPYPPLGHVCSGCGQVYDLDGWREQNAIDRLRRACDQGNQGP